MPARAACHRHPLRARLRPRRPPAAPGESGGRLAASRLARVAKVRWAETRLATNGEPRRGSDQEAEAFIGCGSQAAPPSPRRRAGRGGWGTRAGGVNCALRRGRLRRRGRPQWRGPVLPQFLLRWRLLEGRVMRSRVGLPPKGCAGSAPGPWVCHLAVWPRTPDLARESANLALTAAVRSLRTRKATRCTFSFLKALSVDSFEFYSSSGRWAPLPLFHSAEADREDWRGKNEGRTPNRCERSSGHCAGPGVGGEGDGRG